MKKLKKMLAGLLGAAMVLTSFGTPAWATSTEPETTTATIDITKKGSITIHKYEYNGTEGTEGTGETSDKNSVPSPDAKPLAGAGFTIYQIADDKDLTNFYSTNPSELPDVDNYVEQNKTTKKWSIKTGIGVKNTPKEETTDSTGVATFDGLALGFYVVVETTQPDKVTDPIKPFIVSVPMTTKNGDKWLYDVNVYPKNSTAYGSVKLVKKGNNKDLLEGVTFVLQKSINNVWTDVTKSEETGKNLNLTTNQKGEISVSGLSQGKYRFIETAIDSKLPGYILDGAKTYEFSVGSDKKITYGDYISDNVTIEANNEKPDMKKEVKRRDQKEGKDDWQHDADYSVGDMVPYRITIDVPRNITQLKEFTLQDKPTNLEDDANSINITCDNNDIVNTAWTKDADSAPVPVKGFKINFVPAEMKAYAGKQIVVSYNAKLLKSAVTKTEGNPNTATLEYSNNILPDTTDTTNPNHDKKQGKDKIEDTAVVYTFSLNIHKTDASTEKTPLQGVEFDLYKEVPAPATGETTTAITSTEASALGLKSDKYWLKINTSKLITDKNGDIAQSGLSNGEYYLVETKTNKGFNLLKSPVHVVLNIEYTTKWSKELEWVDETVDGKTVRKLVKHSESYKTTTYTKKDTSTGEFDVTFGTMTETIINRKGFTLPKTGDIGTAMFLIIGIGGMLAAVYIMLRGRKRA